MCGTCNLSSPCSKRSSSSPSTLTYNPATLFTSQFKPVDFGNFGHFGHFEHFGHLWSVWSLLINLVLFDTMITMIQSIANIRIYSNIRIFLAEYLIFEYEYKKIGKRIYSNIRSIKKSGHEYIWIFVNFLQIYSNIWIFC